MQINETINVISELERCGIGFQFVSEDEVKTLCPFHSDKDPSCAVSLSKRAFLCRSASCGRGGDVVTLLAGFLKCTRFAIVKQLEEIYGKETKNEIPMFTVEKYHNRIWEAPPLIAELRKRGITSNDIRKYRLGMDQGRITIPIFNSTGSCVNIRKYMPGAPSADKMRNLKGRGEVRLYPIEQTKFSTIVLCAGEMKAVAVAERMNKHGIGAVSTTGGENSWKREFNEYLKGKTVYVCYDIDKAGVSGAEKLCEFLRLSVQKIHKIDLPLNPDKYAKGDVSDYFGIEMKTDLDFLDLIQKTKEWVSQKQEIVDLDSSVIQTTLADALSAKNVGKRVQFEAIVSTMDSSPYIIPNEVKCNCTRDQTLCVACPIFPMEPDQNGFVTLTIHSEHPSVLEMIAVPRKGLVDALKRSLKIPPCKVVNLSPQTFHTVEDVRLVPKLEISSKSSDQIVQSAFCIGQGLEANVTYKMTGRVFPNPRDQQSLLLISDWEGTSDALSSFCLSPDEIDELRVFSPTDWTPDSIQEKLDEIYSDFEANVTRIFLRRDLHLAVDLGYHSPLLMEVDGRQEKGWTEILIIGDSSQGKTDTTMSLKVHYDLGERIECKNATVSGLLGGLQKYGDRFFVSWGVIPTNDRRLVVLEEIKGASIEILSKLTDMRSSGMAEIPKIEKRRAHARTRLIAVSNPRSDSPLKSYNFGVVALSELMGSPEDLRRFDMCLVMSSDQIEQKVFTELLKNRPKIKHRFTADLCKKCILWAWSRKKEQVYFEEDTTTEILNASARLCAEFTDGIPIVDKGSMRFKLARLSCALAARLFCADISGEFLCVLPQHVQYMEKFLRRIYSEPSFGYKDYSDAVKTSSELLDEEEIKVAILCTPYSRDLVRSLLYTNSINLHDLCDWNSYDGKEGLEFLGLLVRKHALIREANGRTYRKTPDFIVFLKKLLIEGNFERPKVEKRAF